MVRVKVRADVRSSLASIESAKATAIGCDGTGGTKLDRPEYRSARRSSVGRRA